VLTNYDAQGLSAYARALSALLSIVAEDRRIVKANTWALTHLFSLEIMARDFVASPSNRNPLFISKDASYISSLAVKAQKTLTYSLSTLVSDVTKSWHQVVTTALRNLKPFQASSFGGLGEFAYFVGDVYRRAADAGSLFARILANILRGLLREASTEAGDMWLALAQSQIDSCTLDFQHCLRILAYHFRGHLAPQRARTIINCVASLNLESPRLDRIRNELASRILAVRPSASNSSGLPLLRLLNASAPPPNSGAVFLPQQRSVFLLQALQKWVEESEELDEEIESQLAELFINVAPIVQSIPGAHWNFIKDVIESNLDVRFASSRAICSS
jgi:hypothetical protein